MARSEGPRSARPGNDVAPESRGNHPGVGPPTGRGGRTCRASCREQPRRTALGGGVGPQSSRTPIGREAGAHVKAAPRSPGALGRAAVTASSASGRPFAAGDLGTSRIGTPVRTRRSPFPPLHPVVGRPRRGERTSRAAGGGEPRQPDPPPTPATSQTGNDESAAEPQRHGGGRAAARHRERAGVARAGYPHRERNRAGRG